MRAKGNEFAPNEALIDFTFEGKAQRGRLGETVAAALMAEGIGDLRIARDGSRRGVFCGMGVCQECLVEIDGIPNQRACMTKLSHPVAMKRQVTPARLAAPQPIAAARPDFSLEPDILVIGGGAAGLTAAAVAAECSAQVVLVDERPAPGGQFFKQPAATVALPRSAVDEQYSQGSVLIERARAAGVRFVDGAAIDASLPLRIDVLWQETLVAFRPRRLIVATGAYERGLPVPGWTLPGVMTTGAAQTLLRSYRVLAGRRIVVAGNGPLNLQVALELKRAGADVAAVAEAAPPPGIAALASAMTMAATAPRLLASGLGYLWSLRRLGVPVYFATRLGALRPGLVATLASPKGNSEIEADAVCMGYGFLPNNELLRLLNCEHRYDARRRHLVTSRDEWMRTTVAGVLAAGDCCGLSGARVAMAEGVLAGANAAADVGRKRPAAIDIECARAERESTRHRRFQTALWQVFAATPPHRHTNLDADVCRCEGVTEAEIDAVIASGSDCIGSLKRQTRLGMGRCQGRYCVPEAVERLFVRLGDMPDETAFAAPRSPVKPVPIAAMTRQAARSG